MKATCMPDLLNSLASFGFAKVGSLVLDDSRHPKFGLHEVCAGHGWVYLWLEVSDSATSVVYVGKAGKTLGARCEQHRGGFKGGSATGTQHARRLCTGIDAGKRYELWARKSEIITLFGEAGISMSEAEERAFIQKFQPRWNFGSVIDAHGSSITQSPPTPPHAKAHRPR